MNAEWRGPHDHVEDQTPAELRESAYRRGYEQGIAAVVDGLSRGTRSELDAWVKEISYWRYRIGKHEGPRDRIDLPPLAPWMES